ncbi:MAG: DUF86 domain-containing protein [Candidatus Eisenbacteria bacterium]|uniref:DUF86 domain-containing protein n=1 Tax=Eiseniibacteriota bacterium TaxID=2212470 RepID=A0A948W7Q9_UNCEI|nr:DUF86 domain-containing protein [Candidatus Eisenbacteria bacterium]MBU1949031.1 DUF86 domain-containing protein [Candidatus Eisenbacteria bacterium]MBU2692515.1 DUF86 domain-containing protein [Candidatus Eisenbacteria bacterium]
MQHDDNVYLAHMLDMARKAQSLLHGKTRADFDNSEVLRLALLHLLQIIGEAANQVSSQGRAANPELPWDEIVGMRHRVVHDYLGIDEEIVWRTVAEDLPALITVLERILDDEEPS